MKTKFKIIFSIIVIVSVIVISSVTILSIRKKIDDKTVKIAFYGLSQDLCQAIQQEFLEDERISAKYDLLAAGNVDLGNITNKYDMIFAWNGDVTQSLSKSAERIPAKVFENIPISLRNEYCIPILLDHFELAFNTDLIEKTQVNPLESFQSFTDFLQESKKYVFSPFFTYGIDEKMLLALTGSFVEALGGLESYKNLIDLMKTYKNLEDFCNIGLNEDGLCYADVLNMLKVWPKEEIIHPQWTVANRIDLEVFASDAQIACFYTNLSEHRKMKYETVSKFSVAKMPVVNEDVAHCLIAPSVNCVLISNNSNAKNFLKKLLTVEVQTRLSDKSMLAPVCYRAESYDSLADDVRFWAASCEGGVEPDLFNAVFQRDNNKMVLIANEIRDYLR
ncbi:MAG: hypothetical protein SO161_09025 [Treponema sp.]|nr:hypothetical protein [Treponema sp.]